MVEKKEVKKVIVKKTVEPKAKKEEVEDMISKNYVPDHGE